MMFMPLNNKQFGRILFGPNMKRTLFVTSSLKQRTCAHLASTKTRHPMTKNDNNGATTVTISWSSIVLYEKALWAVSKIRIESLYPFLFNLSQKEENSATGNVTRVHVSARNGDNCPFNGFNWSARTWLKGYPNFNNFLRKKTFMCRRAVQPSSSQLLKIVELKRNYQFVR